MRYRTNGSTLAVVQLAFGLTTSRADDPVAANMLDHGSDVVYVPIFFDRREAFRRPCQLLAVDEPGPGVYRFNWSRVKQFIDMVRRIGFKKCERSHLWIYLGVETWLRHALEVMLNSPPGPAAR